MSLVTPSLTYWPNPNTGKPLFNGYVYVGEPDLDPEIEINQKQVTLRLEDGTTLEVGQPLRLSEGGVLQHNGNYAVITADGNYSIKALDRLGAQAFYIPNNSGIFDASQISITVNGYETNLNEYLNSVKDFETVSDMEAMTSTQAKILAESKQMAKTIYNNSTSKTGGAKYYIKTLADYGGTPDGYRDHYVGGGSYVAELLISETINFSQFGVIIYADTTDLVSPLTSDDAIASAFLAAGDFGGLAHVVGSPGTCFVSKPVEFTSHYHGNDMTIKATSGFVGGYVGTTAATSLILDRVKIRPWDTTGNDIVDDLIGFRVWDYNIKMYNPNISRFDYGLMINSFSFTAHDIRIVYCNTNVSAYAPEGQKEINALHIIGGECFGSNDYAFNIGDARFSSPIATGATQGNRIKIENVTTDFGVIRLDRVSAVEISCYFEGGSSALQHSYIYIPNSTDVMQNVHIHDCSCNNIGGSMEYFVYCANPVTGLVVEDIQYTGIPKCAVYTRGSLYSVIVRNLWPTVSHTEAPPVHIGCNSGVTGSTTAQHSIDRLFLDGGDFNTMVGPYRTSRVQAEEVNRTATYSGSTNGVILTSNRVSGISGTVQGANVFELDDKADAVNFNGCQAVTVGGVDTFILRVDYDLGVLYLNNYTLTTETTIGHYYITPRIERYDFATPTDADSALGSVSWNRFTNTQTPNGWIKKAAGWVDMD